MPWLTHGWVCPLGPLATAMVITPPKLAEPNGPWLGGWRKSPIPTISMWRIIPMPVMPNTSCVRSWSASSQASRPTWTLTCS